MFRFRKHCQEVCEWIGPATKGQTISIDSFVTSSPQRPIHRVIELEDYRWLWQKLGRDDIEFANDLTDIHTSEPYSTVLALGLEPCKYKSLTDCAHWISFLASLMTRDGALYVALPITTLLFHRLKLSYGDAVGVIDSQLIDHGLTINNQLLHIDVLYLKVGRA